MNISQKTINKLDATQRQRVLPAFSYAVIKKYGEDEAGYQAALLTYYAFLALFPLLLVLTTVTTIIAGSDSHLQNVVIKGATDYFPILGNQLAAHVHSLHKNGPALVIGILFTLYGARGVANALSHGIQHIWGVPRVKRPGFPKSLFKSMTIIIVGGSGFILASISAGFAAAAGQGVAFRLLSLAVNLIILFWLFSFLINICLPRHVPFKDIRSGAAVMAIGLVVWQAFGTYLLANELKSLDALYSYFALALGLLFWIYLQAQTLFYALEIAAVKSHKLWPRSLNGKRTPADEKAYAMQAARQKMIPQQKIVTTFQD